MYSFLSSLFDLCFGQHHGRICKLGINYYDVSAEDILGYDHLDGLFVGHCTFPLAPKDLHWPMW